MSSADDAEKYPMVTPVEVAWEGGKKKKKKARCIKLHCICAGAGLGAAAFSFLQNAMVNHGQNTHNFNQGKRGNIDTRIPWRSNKER